PEQIRELAPSRNELLAPERVGASAPRARVTPLGAERYELRVMLSQATHDKLRRLHELLGHQLPSGSVAQVLDRTFDMAIARLEKQKFAATRKAGPRRPTTSKRHIPAHVKRAVRQRDGGQCTFYSAAGQRCPARTRLEFDHLLEVAR